MDIIKGRLLFDAFSDVFMSCICFADTVNICGNKHIFIVIVIVIVNLVGPNVVAFDEKIFAMMDQHALHWGMTSHFKIPKKPAPKTASQFKSSMHQRLGPPVTQSFQKGQQQKNKGGFFSGNSSTTGGNSKSVQSWRGRFNTANKKKAGASSGTRQ